MLVRTLGIAMAALGALGAAAGRAEAQATTEGPTSAPAPAAPAAPAAPWIFTSADDGSMADTGGEAAKFGLTAAGQLGVVLARGNTDTRTANAKLELVRTTRAVKDDFEIEGLYGKTGGLVTAERWATTYQRNWNLGQQTFWFANLHYEHDLFSGFAYQSSAATGLGYRFIDTASTKLEAQAGAGYRRLRPELLNENALGQVISRTGEPEEGEAIGNGRIAFEHSFSAQTKITEAITTVAGAENIYLENDLALEVRLNSVLSLSVGYTLRNNSNPPAGLLHTDTLTTVNLVYQVK